MRARCVGRLCRATVSRQVRRVAGTDRLRARLPGVRAARPIVSGHDLDKPAAADGPDRAVGVSRGGRGRIENDEDRAGEFHRTPRNRTKSFNGQTAKIG